MNVNLNKVSKLALVLALTFVGTVSCASSQYDALNTDEDFSNKAVRLRQINVNPYLVENFTTAKTMSKVDKVLDGADLTGYAVVTQDGVSQPLLTFKTFGPCYDAGTQMTNPEQYVAQGGTLPLAEPGTGLFPPSANGSGATRCVTNAGTVLQIEQKVMFSTSPIVLTQPPIYQIQEDPGTAAIDIEKLRQEIRNKKSPGPEM